MFNVCFVYGIGRTFSRWRTCSSAFVGFLFLVLYLGFRHFVIFFVFFLFLFLHWGFKRRSTFCFLSSFYLTAQRGMSWRSWSDAIFFSVLCTISGIFLDKVCLPLFPSDLLFSFFLCFAVRSIVSNIHVHSKWFSSFSFSHFCFCIVTVFYLAFSRFDLLIFRIVRREFSPLLSVSCGF